MDHGFSVACTPRGHRPHANSPQVSVPRARVNDGTKGFPGAREGTTVAAGRFVNAPPPPGTVPVSPSPPVNVTQVMVGLAAMCVIVTALKLAASFLIPLVFAAILAALFSPLVTWVSHRGIPPIVGALLVLLIEVAILSLVAVVLAMAASEVTQRAPYYGARTQEGLETLRYTAGRLGIHVQMPNASNIGDHVMPIVGVAAGKFATTASDLAVVLLVVLFSLAEFAGLGEKLRALAPASSPLGFERVDRIVRDVQKYLVVKTLTSLLAAVCAYILLKVFGVGLALLLAVIMFLLHFIPNVGTFLATVPAIALAFVDKGPGTALGVGIGFITLNTIIGSVLEPRILGRTLGVSPFVILVAMLFWGWIWGPAGALLAVPLTVAGKIILENTRFAWLARLVEPASEPDAATEGSEDSGRPSLTQRLTKPLGIRPLSIRRPSGIGLGAKPPKTPITPS